VALAPSRARPSPASRLRGAVIFDARPASNQLTGRAQPRAGIGKDPVGESLVLLTRNWAHVRRAAANPGP